MSIIKGESLAKVGIDLTFFSLLPVPLQGSNEIREVVTERKFQVRYELTESYADGYQNPIICNAIFKLSNFVRRLNFEDKKSDGKFMRFMTFLMLHLHYHVNTEPHAREEIRTSTLQCHGHPMSYCLIVTIRRYSQECMM